MPKINKKFLLQTTPPDQIQPSKSLSTQQAEPRKAELETGEDLCGKSQNSDETRTMDRHYAGIEW